MEEFRTVGRRDECPPGFRRVVSRTSCRVAGHEALDPQSADAAVPRALKQLESQYDAKRIAKDAGWSVNQLKETWKI
ncbi:MAG TPA: hypothetical protein VK731_09515 [Candidatus Cybelea sp.]|nr:hypothetical protein [Candidatus Cybelea sp.]